MVIRPKFAFRDQAEPLAFAHRGGDAANLDGQNCENTMAAFQSAYNLGYRYFETDVVLTADNRVLAIHGSKDDRAVKRTGLPLRDQLEAMDYLDIQNQVRIGGERIPLLTDVLMVFPEAKVNIDVKTERVAPALGALVRKMNVVDRVCIASFSDARIDLAAAELGGRDKVCTSVGMDGFKAFLTKNRTFFEHTQAACLQLPYNVNDGIGRSDSTLPSPRLFTKGMVDFAMDHGLEVDLWTVNRIPHMGRALDLGVRGIMSDRVVALRQVLQDRGQWAEAA